MFLNEAMGLNLERRTIVDVDINEDLIQSGDFFLIMRLDGLDPMIMWGTGSHGGHTVMALRFDGELYIVESQDAWYWPTPNIQRTPFKTWIQQARNASYNVAWLPLNAESLLKFNEQKAQDFFATVEGLPYGYHNFLYGWIDTPRDNLPPLLPSEFAPIMFSILEKYDPVLVANFFSEGLNKRLGTTGLNIAGLAAEAAKRGMEIQDVMAMPEQDGWEYTGEEPRDGLAYVCSAFITAVYKASGLLGLNSEINATEFTPKDVYNMAIFDTTFERPQACVAADPDLPYC